MAKTCDRMGWTCGPGASVLKGGETGPAIVPGSAARSLLFEKVSSGVMPVGEKKLSTQEIETIRGWIDAGGPKQGENPEALKEQLNAKQVTEREIMVTILHVKCIVCHGKQIREGGLDLRTRAGLLKGGKSGPVIVPGKPEESLFGPANRRAGNAACRMAVLLLCA